MISDMLEDWKRYDEAIKDLENNMEPIVESILKKKIESDDELSKRGFEWDGSFGIDPFDNHNIVCYGECDDPLDPFYIILKNGEDYDF